MELYGIVDKRDGRIVYIGVTSTTAKKRFAQHRSESRRRKSKQYLHRALKKYGHKTFEVKALVIANDWGYLLSLERAAIQAFNTFAPNGYNLTRGGDGIVGYRPDPRDVMRRAEKLRGRPSPFKGQHIHSEEVRKKIGDAQRGRPSPLKGRHTHTAESRAILSEKFSGENHPRFGVERSAETKAKISAANKGRKHTDEEKAKVSAALKGRSPSPEARAAISVARRGMKFSEEHKAALREAWQRRKENGKGHREVSSETRAKLSEANKGQIWSAERRAKLSAARKGTTLTPEHRAKIAAGVKAAKNRMKEVA